MWIEVASPHSGRMVRVRLKDVGRSVRDEEGRIFFVLDRSDGGGYYASLTRTGGAKAEKEYLDMLDKQDAAKASGEERSQQQIFDATGKARSKLKGRVLLVLILAALAAAAWAFTLGPLAKKAPTDGAPQKPLETPVKQDAK